jgi:flavin reductase (DIM6/NTAB) family NADH-FMN oxidoreductase RutF
MKRVEMPVADFQAETFRVWDSGWFLLTAGDFAAGRFNTMTVSWGSFGTIWNRPFAQVVVRPTRHTQGFMDACASFTLCAFAEERREALRLLGTKSGRDGDKIAESGLTPAAALRVAAPVFAEAVLSIECRKLYWQDLDPAHFLDPAIEANYPRRDYHRAYFGEVVAIAASPGWPHR